MALLNAFHQSKYDSIYRLAKDTGLSQTRVKAIIKAEGETNPTLSSLEAVVKALGGKITIQLPGQDDVVI